MSARPSEHARHRTIGYIETHPGGKQVIKDPQYRTRGYYDPIANVTKDSRRRTVGSGNLLTSLLPGWKRPLAPGHHHRRGA